MAFEFLVDEIAASLLDKKIASDINTATHYAELIAKDIHSSVIARPFDSNKARELVNGMQSDTSSASKVWETVGGHHTTKTTTIPSYEWLFAAHTHLLDFLQNHYYIDATKDIFQPKPDWSRVVIHTGNANRINLGENTATRYRLFTIN